MLPTVWKKRERCHFAFELKMTTYLSCHRFMRLLVWGKNVSLSASSLLCVQLLNRAEVHPSFGNGSVKKL